MNIPGDVKSDLVRFLMNRKSWIEDDVEDFGDLKNVLTFFMLDQSLGSDHPPGFPRDKLDPLRYEYFSREDSALYDSTDSKDVKRLLIEKAESCKTAHHTSGY